MLDVLHVLHSFPPESRGGVQGYVERLARAQALAGRRVAVLCATWNGAAASQDDWHGLAVHRVPALDAFAQIAELEHPGAASRRVAELLDALAPAAVHVHHWHGLTLDVLAHARARGARTVVTLHDFHTTCALFFRLREERELCAPDVDLATCASCVARAHGLDAAPLLAALGRRQDAFAAELARADVLVCASQAQAAYWSAIPGVGARRPVVLPLPREEAIDPVPPPPVDGPLHVATWGGLVRGKGLLVLLDALRELPPGSIAVHHHGPTLDERFAAELDVHPCSSALTRHGPFDHASLARAVRSYHLAVHPSLFLETHGLTTDEALDLGLPVVVPDRGAPQERIGTRGTTFRVGDPRDLARVLRSVLDDRGQLERWRQGARAAQPSLAEHLGALDALLSSAPVAPADRRAIPP